MFSSRPGQPITLNSYDKGMLARPTPKEVVQREAEKMGSMEDTRIFLPRVSVPSHPGEFVAQRAAYNLSMGKVRQRFAQEWEGRRAREAAATMAAEADARARKAERDSVKRITRKVALEAQSVVVAQQAADKATRRAVASSGRGVASALALHERRRQWLAELEEDARSWITPERVDSMITPSIFSQKFAWQWEAWFQGKELKRQLGEDARRSRKPGKPFTELVLPPTLTPFEDDWESADEDEGKSLLRSPADAEAAKDSSGLVRRALEGARQGSSARGVFLSEPAYDENGERRFYPGSSQQAVLTQAREARKLGGVSLAELSAGKSLPEIISDYEAWLEDRAKDIEKLNGKHQDESGFLPPRHNSTNKVIIDDGEREVENAYIVACVRARNVDALYYALARKRARCERGGFSVALGRLESTWGDFMDEIEVRGMDPNSVAPLGQSTTDGDGASQQLLQPSGELESEGPYMEFVEETMKTEAAAAASQSAPTPQKSLKESK